MKFSPIVFIMLSCIECASAAPPMGVDAQTLRKLPGVVRVENAKPVAAPKRQVVHLLDWHWVSKEVFATDIRDVSDDAVSDEEIEKRYAAFLDDVDAVQSEQMRVLKELAAKHGIDQVYCEGLTDEAMPAYQKRIAALKKFEKFKPQGDTPIERFILSEYRDDLLRIGAAGRLLVKGQLKGILTADDAKELEASNPIDGDSVRLEAGVIERRENAVIEKLKAGGAIVVLIMGGGHDLGNNVPNDWEYLRVETKQYRRANSE